MNITVLELLEVLQSMAPLDTAEEWDNVGLLLGDREQAVTTVYCALDVTRAAIEGARQVNAEVLLTHHPLMFHPVRQIRQQDPEGALLLALARSGLCHIAMHTNWDRAQGGVNDALAEVLGLRVLPPYDGTCRRCRLEEATTLGAWRQVAEGRLAFPVRAYGPEDRPVQSIWLCGGAGGGELLPAIEAGADAVLTGEIKHHEILAFLEAGVGVLEAGHAATELPGVTALADALQNALHAVQYNVRVITEKNSFWG